MGIVKCPTGYSLNWVEWSLTSSVCVCVYIYAVNAVQELRWAGLSPPFLLPFLQSDVNQDYSYVNEKIWFPLLKKTLVYIG